MRQARGTLTAEAVLRTLAGKLQSLARDQVCDRGDFQLQAADVRQVLAETLAQAMAPDCGAVVLWWDEQAGLQLNIARHELTETKYRKDK